MPVGTEGPHKGDVAVDGGKQDKSRIFFRLLKSAGQENNRPKNGVSRCIRQRTGSGNDSPGRVPDVVYGTVEAAGHRPRARDAVTYRESG